MLPLLFCLFIHIIKCLAVEPANHNEPLTEQLHKSLLKVNAFLEDVQHKIKSQRDALRNFDYEDHSKNEFLDYSLTSFWWNGTPATGQITPQTSFLTLPNFEETIYVTPIHNPDSPPPDPWEDHTMEPDNPAQVRPPQEIHDPNATMTSTDAPIIDPILGMYLGPPGEIPETSPQYSVEALLTLTRTVPTTRKPTTTTTPDPRPPGPGYYLQPDEGVPTINTESTPPSPQLPLEPELKPEDLTRKPYIDTSELIIPTTPKEFDYPIVPEKLFTPSVVPIYPSTDKQTTKATTHNEFPTIPTVPTEQNSDIPPVTESPTPVDHETSTDHTDHYPDSPIPTLDDVYPSTPYENTPITAEPITTTLHPNVSFIVDQWLKEMNATAGNMSKWSVKPTQGYVPSSDRTTRNHSLDEETLYPEYTPEPPLYITPNSSYPDPDRDFPSTYREPSPKRGVFSSYPVPTPDQGVFRSFPVPTPDQEIFSSYPVPSPDQGILERQGMVTTTELEGPTATGIQEAIILEDALGFPYLGTSPTTLESMRTTLVEGRPANIPEGVEFSSSTVAGDVLLGNVPDTPEPLDPFHEDIYHEMDRLQFGYMSMFMLRITKLVATRKKEYVEPVIMHTEFIITKFFNTGQLAYLGQPLLTVVMNIGIGLYTPRFDELQSYASMVYFMILQRRSTSAIDVNSIMDYADSLYTEEEGERLFFLLKDFEDYPNNTMPGKMLCEEIVLAFMNPHRRLKGTERGQKLIDSINYSLETRFPNLRNVRRVWDKSGRKSNGPIFTTLKPISTPNKRIPVSTGNRKKIKRLKTNQSDINTNRTQKRTIPNLDTKKNGFNYERMLRRNLFNPNSLEVQRTASYETTTTSNIQKRFNIITSGHTSYIRDIQSKIPLRVTKSTRWTPPFIRLDMRPTTSYKLDSKMFGEYRPGFRAYTKEPPRFFQKSAVLVDKPKDKATVYTKRKKRKLTTAKARQKSIQFKNIIKYNTKSKETKIKDNNAIETNYKVTKSKDTKNTKYKYTKYKVNKFIETNSKDSKSTDTKSTEDSVDLVRPKERKPIETISKDTKYQETKYTVTKAKETKPNLLRRIVERSSYSDEEEALKLNLISAMIHGNRTFQRTEIDDTVMTAFLKEKEELRGN